MGKFFTKWVFLEVEFIVSGVPAFPFQGRRMAWTTKTFLAALVLASLTASTRVAAHGRAPVLALTVTDAAPTTLVAGQDAEVLVRGNNFSSQQNLKVKVGNIEATSVLIIGDDLLCADFPIPQTGPIGTASLAVDGGDDNVGVLPEALVIIGPPPDPGPAPAPGMDYIREVMNFARDNMIFNGIEFLGRMNEAKNKHDLNAILQELVLFGSRMSQCTTQILDPLRAAGFETEVNRAIHMVNQTVQDFINAGELFITAGNKGPNSRAVQAGDSELVFARRSTLYVDAGRGPIPLPLSGSMRLRVTESKKNSMAFEWRNMNLVSEGSIGSDHAFAPMRFRQRGSPEGSMDPRTGQTTHEISWDASAEGMAEPAIITASANGFTAPFRNFLTSTGMPNSLRALTDADNLHSVFTTVSLPENFQGGGATGYVNMNWQKIPLMPRFPRVR
jgi:hypothetical protein